MTGICLPRHTHARQQSLHLRTAATPRTCGQVSSPSRGRQNTYSPVFSRRARLPCHVLRPWDGMQQQVSIWKSGADAGICPAQPGACCIAWRTTRRPKYLLRHVLCAQLHCRDWVFTSMCRIHAQLLRPPKRTAALHDLSRKQRCHADALLLPPVKVLRPSAIFPPRRRAGRRQRCASLHIATGTLCEFERRMGHPLSCMMI